MKTEHFEISDIEKALKKPEKIETKNLVADLKKGLKIERNNPIVAYLEKFDNYFKKQKKFLKAGETLFSPGKDNFLYIIISGAIKIYSYSNKGEKKEVGVARAGSFIGEGIIFGRNQKDVEAVSASNSEIFALTKEDLKKLEEEHPEEAINLYRYIIEITNKRLLDSGKELANIYEATNKIQELADNGEKGFIQILDYLKNILAVDYIIYIENHPVLDNFLYYKYNTNLKNIGNINQKVGNEITADMEGILDSSFGILGTFPGDNVYAIPLKKGQSFKGILIAGKRKGVITDNEMRVSKNIGVLIAGVVEQIQKQADQKAMQMSKNFLDNSFNSI